MPCFDHLPFSWWWWRSRWPCSVWGAGRARCGGWCAQSSSSVSAGYGRGGEGRSRRCPWTWRWRLPRTRMVLLILCLRSDPTKAFLSTWWKRKQQTIENLDMLFTEFNISLLYVGINCDLFLSLCTYRLSVLPGSPSLSGLNWPACTLGTCQSCRWTCSGHGCWSKRDGWCWRA